MITWSEFFPNPSAQYIIEQDKAVIRSNNFRPQQRERFKRKQRQTAKCTFDLSLAYFKLFCSIHRHVLNNGNEWFIITLMTENGLEIKTARFVLGRYNAKYRADNRFNVSCDLEFK